jgi:hypothetical protein
MWCWVATGGAALVAAADMGVLMTLHGPGAYLSLTFTG